MADPIKIVGLQELEKQLKKLKKPRNAARAATRAGAVVIKKQAIANLEPRHKKKVDIRQSRRKSGSTHTTFDIGPKARHWGLIFLEYGAAPHEITPKRKKVLSGSSSADVAREGFVAGKVMHPGVTPTYWLSKAISQSRDKAIEAFAKKMRERIAKEILK
jgi:HK97 gp10 family phage protein